jgi:hypothetical protein
MHVRASPGTTAQNKECSQRISKGWTWASVGNGVMERGHVQSCSGTLSWTCNHCDACESSQRKRSTNSTHTVAIPLILLYFFIGSCPQPVGLPAPSGHMSKSQLDICLHSLAYCPVSSSDYVPSIVLGVLLWHVSSYSKHHAGAASLAVAAGCIMQAPCLHMTSMGL